MPGELIQKQSGKGHRRHLSACIPARLISAAKRRPAALQIFQNRAEKVLGRADATHKHPRENVRHGQGRTWPTNYRNGLLTAMIKFWADSRSN